MRLLVDLLQFLTALAVSPIILYRALTTGKYRQGWGERRGFVPVLSPAALWPRVWVHAVSMGEVNAIRGLVAAWRARSPGTEFVISTTTDTGQARARELFPDLTVIRYPLDLSRFVRRAMDRIKPTMIVLTELEVWYQFIAEARQRGLPVAIVNGRLSERSVRRFGLIRPVARRMFESLTWVGTQDDAYAERFQRMGVPAGRVEITGSLKWDTAQVADNIPGSDLLARSSGIDPDRPLWVCGSTGPGEEEIILRAYTAVRKRHPQPGLAIIPRKPERFDEVAELIAQAGFECIRRSRCPDGTTSKPIDNAIVLGDTMGELRKFYSLASVVLVGRTIAAMGGSDMMEVAALAKPILVGPHTENFADAVHQLRRHDGIRVIDAELDDPLASEKLAEAVAALLDQPEAARQLAMNARKVVQENRGATERTLARLIEIAGRGSHEKA
jgi:3-deoxy-D-manno-octulosonic-acid transferase